MRCFPCLELNWHHKAWWRLTDDLRNIDPISVFSPVFHSTRKLNNNFKRSHSFLSVTYPSTRQHQTFLWTIKIEPLTADQSSRGINNDFTSSLISQQKSWNKWFHSPSMPDQHTTPSAVHCSVSLLRGFRVKTGRIPPQCLRRKCFPFLTRKKLSSLAAKILDL